MRNLTLPEIQARFDRHAKLHRFEVDKLFEKIKHKPFTEIQYRYLEIGIRHQFIYDIETSDFDPEQNFIICYCGILRDIVTEEIEHVQDSITKSDIKKAVSQSTFDFDKRLLTTLSHNMKQAHHVVGHYSTKFDNPYFRSRCLLTNQQDLIPGYGYQFYGDTWRMMKTTMKAKRNTLKNFIRQTTGNDEKTFVDLKYWYITHFKDHKLWKKSMDYIIDHCVKDVKMTYEGLKRAELFNNIGRAKA
jgi:hypothetical protein